MTKSEVFDRLFELTTKLRKFEVAMQEETDMERGIPQCAPFVDEALALLTEYDQALHQAVKAMVGVDENA
mgnify:CR=1 FL=1